MPTDIPCFIYLGRGCHAPPVVSNEEHDPLTERGRRAICHLIALAEYDRAAFRTDIAYIRHCQSRARYLHAHGVIGVEAAIVHPVLSGQAVERIDASSIQRVVVTNTLPLGPEKRIPKLEYVSVAALLAQAIKAIHEGDSVSALFT